jgi:glycosyltransferase involved in cell wall biosynthesis
MEILFRHQKKSNIVVQFAGYQSFLPVLFGRIFPYKTFIILGGTDCASFPSISYGSFNNKILKHFVAFSLKHASHLLPVSDSLVHYEYTYQNADFPAQGYLAFLPNVTTLKTTIYNGYESNSWYVGKKQKKSFVTIGANLGTTYAKKLKGIDLILETASYFPHCVFNIVGGKSIRTNVPRNVILLDLMDSNELADFISTQEFYLQLSMSEGFPNALCEAMMSGCIPIVSNVGAMPLIVGDLGYVLMKKDSLKLIEIIQLAVSTNQENNYYKSRQRIEENFPLSLRAERLKAILMQ